MSPQANHNLASTKGAAAPDVSVILPTFNERDNIVPLIVELKSKFDSNSLSTQILVVDDSSPDGTAQTVKDAFPDDESVKVITREENPGLAVSIREGIENAQGEYVLVMDTDFNHLPIDALQIYQVAQHVDIGIGSRFIFGGGMDNLLRYYLSYLYNIFMRLTIGTRLDDNLSGFFAMRRDRLVELDFDKIFWGYGDYYFRLLLLSQRKKFRHLQIPVHYGARKSGESKTRFFAVFGQYTREVLWLTFKIGTKKW